jgi:hypothetical protein
MCVGGCYGNGMGMVWDGLLVVLIGILKVERKRCDGWMTKLGTRWDMIELGKGAGGDDRGRDIVMR